MSAKRRILSLTSAGILIGLIAFNNCTQSILWRKDENPSLVITGNPATTSAKQLRAAICSTILRCHTEVSRPACEGGVNGASGAEVELGLPNGSYPTFSDIEQAEQSRLVSGNSAPTGACAAAVMSLSCADPNVQNAYDPNLANPFQNTSQMLATASCSSVFTVKVKAFPTAEGFGQHAIGGRGGTVLRVTNLNDSGPGSLREAMNTKQPRIVVFDVSGTIDLASDIDLHGETASYLTLAGQTSPGGVQLKGPYGIKLGYGVHDVIIRYLRIRPGGPVIAPQTGEAFVLYSPLAALPTYNVIIDHCSFEWTSRYFSVVSNLSEISLQWSIFANGIDSSGRDGLIINGYFTGNPNQSTISVHHNLLANERENMPHIERSGVVDFRNNVVYNWSGNNALHWGAFAENFSAFGNQVHNHYIAGPLSSATYFSLSNGGPTRIDGTAADRGGTKIYAEGNWGPNCPTGCANEWNNKYYLVDHWEYAGDGSFYGATEAQFRLSTPLPVAPVTTDSTGALKSKVLSTVGASRPARDSADQAVIDNVTNLTGAPPSSGGPWPNLTGGAAPTDSDGDGMPDVWESAKGLNPNDPLDGRAAAPNGYTNVENYLNQLAGDL